jgi:hypothetical protein
MVTVYPVVRYGGATARTYGAAGHGSDQSSLVFSQSASREKKPESRQSEIFVLLHLCLPPDKLLRIRPKVVQTDSKCQERFRTLAPFYGTFVGWRGVP